MLVLTESAFTVWQKGTKADSLYDSGQVSRADVRVPIPPGEQFYYVVFNNRASQATVKRVDARLMLDFGSWLPH